MGILDNLENSWDIEESPNLSVKLFSDMVCAECESKSMPVTDNMGREIFWEDLGRPTNA